MSPEDFAARNAILSMIYSTTMSGAIHFGLYRINNLFGMNLSLQLEAAGLNRYPTQRYAPSPSLQYTSPYVYFCYIGMGTLELIQLHEYEPAISTAVLEDMLNNKELVFGDTIQAPPPYAGTTLTLITFP